MPEIINCPSCQRKLQVPEALIGQDVPCPTCGATFTASVAGPVPTVAGPPPPAPEPPAYGLEGERERERPPRRPDRPRPHGDYDDYGEYGEGRRRPRRRDLLPHRGATVLTLGILSLVIGGIGLVLGPIAWIMGNQDLAEIQAGRMDPEGESTTNAGRICGMIGTILNILGVLACCVVFFIGMMGAQQGRRF
jgi:hypothetical protein